MKLIRHACKSAAVIPRDTRWVQKSIEYLSANKKISKLTSATFEIMHWTFVPTKSSKPIPLPRFIYPNKRACLNSVLLLNRRLIIKEEGNSADDWPSTPATPATNGQA